VALVARMLRRLPAQEPSPEVTEDLLTLFRTERE